MVRRRQSICIFVSALALTVLVYFNYGALNTLSSINKDDLFNKPTSKLHDDSDKLVSVYMFVRHGARTPLHLAKGIEEVNLDPKFNFFLKIGYIIIKKI